MEVVELLNSWWKDKSVSHELAPPYKRKVFKTLKELLEMRQMIVLSGLRRVGKSTLMYQLIGNLLASGVNPENIFYYSFDEKTDDPVSLLKAYSELTGVDWQKENCFVFLDEVQKLEGWSDKLKVLYDRLPTMKMVVSGSSSFQLERDAKSNLAGRHFIVNVSPLSFREYLELKGTGINLKSEKLWREEIRREFKNYLFRPFPEVVPFNELSLVKSYIRDGVIEKVLKADLPQKFKHLNEDLLVTLVEIFYSRPGAYLNYDELARDLKVSKKTLLQHVYYLEFAYLIRRIKNFRPSARSVSRKLQRVYPFHFSLRFGWNGKTDFETVVASFLDAKYYWRENGKEVDFLLVGEDILPVEVKEGSDVNAGELKPLVGFMKRFSLKKGLVVYNGEEGHVAFDGLSIRKIPLWKLALSEIALAGNHGL